MVIKEQKLQYWLSNIVKGIELYTDHILKCLDKDIRPLNKVKGNKLYEHNRRDFKNNIYRTVKHTHKF